MYAYSTAKRVTAIALIAIAIFSTQSFAGEPKVVRASHLEEATKISRETPPSGESVPQYSPQWPEPPNTGAMLMRVVIGTAVVLVLCVGTMWFGKPWLQKLQVAGAGTPSFHIEGSVAVGNRAMLYLVRVGETQLVAGTDVSGLKSLIALPPSFKEVLDNQIPDDDSPVLVPPRSTDFRSVIRGEIHKP